MKIEEVNVPEVLNDLLEGTNEYQEAIDPTVPTVQAPEENEEQQILQQNEGAIAPDPITHGAQRSSRQWRPAERYLQSKEQESISLPAAAQIAEYDEECKTFLDDAHSFTVLASTDGDTMYWDQAALTGSSG
jgi:hypothetical protein